MSLEHSIEFFDKHFAWTLEDDPAQGTATSRAADKEFYATEFPEVVREAREALRVLKLLCRTS